MVSGIYYYGILVCRKAGGIILLIDQAACEPYDVATVVVQRTRSEPKILHQTQQKC